ncbi:MAG: hypothetical protein HYW47_07920 [Deltaproteobacteria bacterium]|nr:hypothetical protein [Deltaproteobacteria bacterium]
MSDFLKINYSQILENGIVKEKEFKQARSIVSQALEKLLKWKSQGKIGFLDLPYQKITQLKKKVDSCLRGQYKTLVHCGIGGSSLGPKTLIQALAPNASIYFLDNIDPTTFKKIEKTLNMDETLFYIVSKSGNTSETKMQYEWAKSLSSNIAVCTNDQEGFLFEEAKKHGFPLFTIPENVGGRYSVFTSVGLVPALFSGLNVEKILKGGQTVSLKSEELISFVALAYLLHKKQKRNVMASFIYSDELQEFGHWLVQLWSESLGKQKNLNNQSVFEGSFPILGRGACAQHSMLQLLSEGPENFWAWFIEIENFGIENSFSKLIKIEAKATYESLLSKGRPCVSLKLKEVSEGCLGALLFFYECFVALFGLALEINPFDQPGVEDTKRRIDTLLNERR